MSVDFFDPTTSPKKESISYAPRPQKLDGLKIGLVENSKFNSKTLLIKISERLQKRFNMEMVHLNTKPSSSHSVEESAIKEFKAKTDFVIAGIGD